MYSSGLKHSIGFLLHFTGLRNNSIVCQVEFFNGTFSFVCSRSKWQRAGAVRLFAEHVILFNDQDVGVDSESVFGLWKVQSSSCLLF